MRTPKLVQTLSKKNLSMLHSHLMEQQLFESLDLTNKGYLLKNQLIQALKAAGLDDHHDSLKHLFGRLGQIPDDHKIKFEFFIDLTKDNFSLIQSALTGRLIIPDFENFCGNIKQIYNKIRPIKEGQVASYIPQLARVNPNLLSISICTIDGQMFSIGDIDATFSAQSTAKVLNYCLAQEEHGEAKVHQYIGKEPSGHRFNVLRLNKNNMPHNPFINAGAIMACALIRAKLDPADKFDYVMNAWKDACGGLKPGFNNAVYLSEKATADRNFAIAYFMQEKKAFPPHTNIQTLLEFYFQCCSIELTTTHLATMGATLANSGVCPLTQKQVFHPNTVKNCLSLMYSCGLYDFSGQFAFTVGLPAKSGISGAIILVIPNVMGASIFSPRIDSYGNSLRGLAFCTELVKYFNFHNYDSLVRSTSKEDPRYRKKEPKLAAIMSLIWAASQGDLMEIQRLHASGVDYNLPDYDGRTALHLAASEGQSHVVRYLLSKNVTVNPIDRWGGTPLSDAIRSNHLDIIELLKEKGGY